MRSAMQSPCPGRNIRIAFHECKSGEGPAAGERPSSCKVREMPIRGWSRRAAVPYATKILGHNVKFRRCGSLSPPPSHLPGHPRTAAAVMSHNRRPMSIGLTDNLKSDQADGRSWQPYAIARQTGEVGGPNPREPGIANARGSARYQGLCRAAVVSGLLKKAMNLSSKV